MADSYGKIVGKYTSPMDPSWDLNVQVINPGSTVQLPLTIAISFFQVLQEATVSLLNESECERILGKWASWVTTTWNILYAKAGKMKKVVLIQMNTE